VRPKAVAILLFPFLVLRSRNEQGHSGTTCDARANSRWLLLGAFAEELKMHRRLLIGC
jgi:hypothetical protein